MFEQVWNQGREGTIDELFDLHRECYGYPEPNAVLIGPDSVKTIWHRFRGTFSNMRITADEIFSNVDWIAIRWIYNMLNTGGAIGIAAAHKHASVIGRAITLVWEGRIHRGWNYMDLTTLNLDLRAK
jgi:predicted ester cyclase